MDVDNFDFGGSGIAAAAVDSVAVGVAARSGVAEAHFEQCSGVRGWVCCVRIRRWERVSR